VQPCVQSEVHDAYGVVCWEVATMVALILKDDVRARHVCARHMCRIIQARRAYASPCIISLFRGLLACVQPCLRSEVLDACGLASLMVVVDEE